MRVFKLIVPNRAFDGELIDKYLVVKVWHINKEEYRYISEVSITENTGRRFYNVIEPYSEYKDRIEKLLNELKFWLKPEGEAFSDPVNFFINKAQEMENLDSDLEKALRYYLSREIYGYGPLTTVIYDPNIEDISCLGVNRELKVWHKRHSGLGWLTCNFSFNESQLDEIIALLLYKSGKSVSVMRPIAEGELPEGYRINVSYKNEISDFGSSFTIRKFREEPITIVELIEEGTIDRWTASYLWLMLDLKGFILIMGASGSGKTTLLNAIAMLLNPNSKIISLEDTREIYLPHDGWKPLKTRIGEISFGKGADIDLFDLARFALRERMDYLILGESRGEEARQLFNAAATGHGAITTFHASSIEGLIARLKNSPISVGESLLELLDTVVHIVLIRRNGKIERKVKCVYEQRENGWEKIVEWKSGKLWLHNKHVKRLFDRASNHGMSEEDVFKELERRECFLAYLQKIKAYRCETILEHLKLFYAGKLKLPDFDKLKASTGS